MGFVNANNVCTFIGRLTDFPELKMTEAGKELVNFTLAIDKGFGENRSAIFARFVAFGGEAKLIAKLTKGQEISVVTEYDIREYTAGTGEKRQSHEFRVAAVKPHAKKEAAEASSEQIPLAYAAGAQENLPKFEEISADSDLPF